MRFDLVMDGRLHRVELGMGEGVTVEVDGRAYRAQGKRTGKGISVEVEGREFLIDLEGTSLSIDGKEHKVEIRNLRRGRPSWSHASGDEEGAGAGKAHHKVSGGEGIIQPPMPGRVVSIKVNVGDQVDLGSPVLVLEAMKMQNEIVSNTKGVVREIRVSEGDLVESGDIMVVIGA